MKVTGLCSICSKPTPALNTCWKCGASVCAACFDAKSGLCSKCAHASGGI